MGSQSSSADSADRHERQTQDEIAREVGSR